MVTTRKQRGDRLGGEKRNHTIRGGFYSLLLPLFLLVPHPQASADLYLPLTPNASSSPVRRFPSRYSIPPLPIPAPKHVPCFVKNPGLTRMYTERTALSALLPLWLTFPLSPPFPQVLNIDDPDYSRFPRFERANQPGVRREVCRFSVVPASSF